MKWTVKEVVVTALCAAVIGVIFTLIDFAYMPLSAALGTVFMEITFGVYMLSAMLPMFLVRKPGFALFGAIVTAGVNLLLGSPYGLQLVLAAFLEGVSIEIAYAIFKYKPSWACLITGACLGAVLVFCRDMFFWGTPAMYGTEIAIGCVIVRFASSIIIGILLTKLITAALVKSGAVKGFACAQD